MGSEIIAYLRYYDMNIMNFQYCLRRTRDTTTMLPITNTHKNVRHLQKCHKCQTAEVDRLATTTTITTKRSTDKHTKLVYEQ